MLYSEMNRQLTMVFSKLPEFIPKTFYTQDMLWAEREARKRIEREKKRYTVNHKNDMCIVGEILRPIYGLIQNGASIRMEVTEYVSDSKKNSSIQLYQWQKKREYQFELQEDKELRHELARYFSEFAKHIGEAPVFSMELSGGFVTMIIVPKLLLELNKRKYSVEQSKASGMLIEDGRREEYIIK